MDAISIRSTSGLFLKISEFFRSRIFSMMSMLFSVYGVQYIFAGLTDNKWFMCTVHGTEPCEQFCLVLLPGIIHAYCFCPGIVQVRFIENNFGKELGDGLCGILYFPVSRVKYKVKQAIEFDRDLFRQNKLKHFQ